MIETTQQDGVAILSLAHGKANALDLELCDAIIAAFKDIETSAVRAIVLTGQGRMFSAGVDLVRLLDGGTAYVRQFLPTLHRLYDTVFHHPKPVIAAINGHAIAGGCVLHCCADRRIMARDSGRTGVTELLVGLPFPALAFEVIRFAVVPRYFPDIVTSGATVPPDVALERGLVDEIVEPGALIERAVAAARTLAALSPEAFAQTKRQIRLPLTERMERNGAAVDAAVTDIWTRPDALKSIEAYVSATFKKS